MEEFKDFFVSRGYEFTGVERDEMHYHFKKEIEGLTFIFLLVAPHEGNNNRYMLRADELEDHDRWSNCNFQRFYTDIEDFKKNWNKWLVFDDELSN